MTSDCNIVKSINEEILILRELDQVYEKNKNWLNRAVVLGQLRSLCRIVNRYEKGYEYYMGIDDNGNPQLKYRQTATHCEHKLSDVDLTKDENT